MTAVRPTQLIVVAGTATDIGKTWVAAEVARDLWSRNVSVCARKPAQSFHATDIVTDADVLGLATGENPLFVCPAHRRYELPMAPPMAADALFRPAIALSELLDEVMGGWPDYGVDVGLVELAGGPRSPLAHDADCVEFTQAVDPDVIVLVADAGLGTVNAVRTALPAFGPLADRVVLHLNRYDDQLDLHRRNRTWLAERDGFALTTDIASLVDRIHPT